MSSGFEVETGCGSGSRIANDGKEGACCSRKEIDRNVSDCLDSGIYIGSSGWSSGSRARRVEAM